MESTTIIIRHRKENLKKCSLRGLEEREECLFLRYPLASQPDCSNAILLTFDAPLLSNEDRESPLLLLDGTWRYAEKMELMLPFLQKLEKRSLPKQVKTAYPRRQADCREPARGLASVEALYVAYLLLGRETEGLLDHYFWRTSFLEKNRDLFASIK